MLSHGLGILSDEHGSSSHFISASKQCCGVSFYQYDDERGEKVTDTHDRHVYPNRVMGCDMPHRANGAFDGLTHTGSDRAGLRLLAGPRAG